MRSILTNTAILILGVVLGVAAVTVWQKTQTPIAIFSPDPTPTPEPERPLLKFAIDQLRSTQTGETPITLDPEPLSESDTHSVYTYTSEPLGRVMSGVVNLPATVSASTSAVVMLRGWVPPTQYSSGTGTKNVAAELAKAGFITIAPDFFGYGTSAPEPSDEWQARFEKPMAVLALINGLQNSGIASQSGFTHKPNKIGLWGHSNGGQIALTALTISQKRLPTSLWAPVTAPFPYSILYFSDEEEDEGTVSRKWISFFDQLYDARKFSFTNYLDGLSGPLLLQQGTNDDAVLKWWSDEFVVKLEKENERRKEVAASQSANQPIQNPIEYEYHVYQGADHNLRPAWDTAVARDIEFFKRELSD